MFLLKKKFILFFPEDEINDYNLELVKKCVFKIQYQTNSSFKTQKIMILNNLILML